MNPGARRKSRLKRLLFRTLPALALVAALLVALLLVSGAQKESAGLDGAYLDNSFIWVLTVTASRWPSCFGVLLPSGAFIPKRPKRRAGAILSARWVRNFLAFRYRRP